MSPLTVRCTVSNCYFHASDNYCGAPSILITSDAVERSRPDSADGPDAAMLVQQIGETPAESPMETACKTFRRR